jgi:hypothetical protein
VKGFVAMGPRQQCKEVGKKGLPLTLFRGRLLRGAECFARKRCAKPKGQRTALRRRNEAEHCEDCGRYSQRREFIQGLNPVLSDASLDASGRSLQRLWRGVVKLCVKSDDNSPPIIVSPLINPDRPIYFLIEKRKRRIGL